MEEAPPRADLKAVVFEDLMDGAEISMFEMFEIVFWRSLEEEKTEEEGDEGPKLYRLPEESGTIFEFELEDENACSLSRRDRRK